MANPLPAKTVTGWAPADDYPAPAELSAVAPGAVTGDEAGELFDRIESSSWDSEVEPTTGRGDKFGGWPMWLQDPAHPDCPDCGAEMEYVAQIGSRGGLAYTFGDCGIAHVHRCRAHPAVIAFSWAGS